MDEREFERLLKIARLKLTDRERKKIKRDIDEVLGYLGRIDRFSADEQPAYQPTHVPTRFRKDKVVRYKDADLLKKGSVLHNGYIIGPKL